MVHSLLGGLVLAGNLDQGAPTFLNSATAKETPIESWRVAVAVGDVRIRPMGSDAAIDWIGIGSGTPIENGFEIEAGVDSHALITNGCDTISLQQNSQIALPVDGGINTTLVLQEFGEVFYQVESRCLTGMQDGSDAASQATGGRFEVFTKGSVYKSYAFMLCFCEIRGMDWHGSQAISGMVIGDRPPQPGAAAANRSRVPVLAAKDLKARKLTGIVEADETYVPERCTTP